MLFRLSLQKLGSKCGFTSEGSIGIFAACAEQIAMFGIVRKMIPEDKVKVVAFSVCGSWILGAHISITANFQPNLLAIILIGKLIGGIVAVFISLYLSVPMARKLEAKDRERGLIGTEEYLADEEVLAQKGNKKRRRKGENSK